MKNVKRQVGAPSKPAEELKFPVALRLTASQRVVYEALGGAKWARRMLDQVAGKA